jgi:hypothetical protein
VDGANYGVTPTGCYPYSIPSCDHVRGRAASACFHLLTHPSPVQRPLLVSPARRPRWMRHAHLEGHVLCCV